jgi:phage-Barnase-EndoU-ColicinE5/D-RelE like nuclease3
MRGVGVSKKGKLGRNRPADISVCQLPCDIINRTLGLELEPGEVVLTRAAQVHAAKRHPGDYQICLPYLGAIVAAPFYIGDDLENAGIELIARLPALGEYILVAVNIVRDEKGRYQIASFYKVSRQKIDGRREKGFLKIADWRREIKLAGKA